MEGVVFGLLAALGFGCTAIFVRLGVRQVRPTTGAWVSLLTSVAVVLALTLVFARQDLTSLAAIAIAWIALMGLLNFGLGRLLNIFSIQRVGATRAAPLFSLAPLSATVLAVVFLGESPTPLMLVGMLFVVGGIGLITSERAAS